MGSIEGSLLIQINKLSMHGMLDERYILLIEYWIIVNSANERLLDCITVIWC